MCEDEEVPKFAFCIDVNPSTSNELDWIELECAASPAQSVQSEEVEEEAFAIVPDPEEPLSSSNIGHRLMTKMGWTEGAGLGAREQGRKHPIMPHKRKRRRGLGFET
eukprot:c15288_g1_i1.p2 GENE.c15288_g1_i1~~c15288_g1_i1.p2  ORF type:complete len:107 (-),score=20.28 c15288_g1_i1:68-388(-)